LHCHLYRHRRKTITFKEGTGNLKMAGDFAVDTLAARSYS
jgi:hypothetical protein